MERIVVLPRSRLRRYVSVAEHQGQKRAGEQPPSVICLLLTGSRRCGVQARHELGSRPIATGRVIEAIPARPECLVSERV
jgi:hypothetical protein